MAEIKHSDCLTVEDEYVTVLVIKKVCESDVDAVERAMHLLRES